MSSIDDFLRERLAAKKARLLELETVLSKIAASEFQTHSLDTGQSRQSMTTHSVSQIRTTIADLESDIVILEARLNGCGVSQGRPGW